MLKLFLKTLYFIILAVVSCTIFAENKISSLTVPPGIFLENFLKDFPKQFSKPYPPEVADYYGKDLCANPGFHCLVIHKGDTWVRLFPNKRQRDIVMRLNRTNAALFYRNWILVPNGFYQVNFASFSPFPDYIPPSKSEEFIFIDLEKYAFAAYNKYGYQVFWGPALGGMKICSDTDTACETPVGAFRVFRKGDLECQSHAFPVGSGGSPMPYCMFFSGGNALHGAYLAGTPNSHGCVQLFPADAAWLNKSFVEAGYPGGTKVIVKKSQQSDN